MSSREMFIVKKLPYAQILEISLSLFIVYLDSGHLYNYICTDNAISVVVKFIFIYRKLGDLHQLLFLEKRRLEHFL